MALVGVAVSLHGQQLLFTDVFFHPWHVDETMAALRPGLSEESAASVVSYVRRVLESVADLRTSAKAMFASQDGRRRVVQGNVMRLGADTRYLDHLHHCVALWAASAIDIGPTLMQLRESFQKEEVWSERLTRTLMSTLIQVPVLGRPSLASAVLKIRFNATQ